MNLSQVYQLHAVQGGRKSKPSREHGDKKCMFNARKKRKCIEPKLSSLERRSRAPGFLPPWRLLIKVLNFGKENSFAEWYVKVQAFMIRGNVTKWLMLVKKNSLRNLIENLNRFFTRFLTSWDITKSINQIMDPLNQKSRWFTHKEHHRPQGIYDPVMDKLLFLCYKYFWWYLFQPIKLRDHR